MDDRLSIQIHDVDADGMVEHFVFAKGDLETMRRRGLKLT